MTGEKYLSATIPNNNVFRKSAKTAKTENALEIFLFAVVAILIILGVNSNFFTLLAAVILGAYILCSNSEKQIEALCFFLPFANIFKLSHDGSSLFTFLQMIPILLFFLKNSAFLKSKVFGQFALLIFYVALVTCISMSSFVLLFKFIIMCFFLMEIKWLAQSGAINYKRIAVAFAIGIIAAGIIGIFKNHIPGLTRFVSNVYYRLSHNDDLDISNRFSGLAENPNYYSIDIIMSLASLLVLYRDKLMKYGFFVLATPLIILGILTQSKAFMLSFAVLVLYFLYLIIKSGKYLEFFVILLFIVFVSYLALHHLGSLSNYVGRFLSIFNSGFDLNSITTGRQEIWNLYLKEIFSDWAFVFVGKGIDSISSQVGAATHNAFLQGIYNIGLIGALLYFFFVFSLCGKKTLSVAFPLIVCLLARFLGANIMFYMNTFYYYLLIILLTNSKKDGLNKMNICCNTNF